MKRFQSLDILRGLIMVLMAIDHVRVYAGVPAGGPDPAIFFTRWVTHFCAPGFAFFAGTAAFLYGIKLGSPSALARYLFTRGFMLVILEITLIRLFWTFNLNLSDFMLAGVIWMLGWCMVLLGTTVRMNARTIGIIGLAIIFFQQLFGYVSTSPYWQFIYTSAQEGPSWIAILYVIVPWVGVMMAGYGFGSILLMEENKRNKLCYVIGFTSILLFIIIGSFLVDYSKPFIFQLLNQRKYPASQLYLMMTLGPLIALIPWAEKAKGVFVNFLSVFGRVPFFYYLAHILIIHISALIVNYFLFGDAHQEWYNSAPFAQVPQENRWSLGLLYFVFVIDVTILYFISKWYSKRKLKYL